MIGKFIKFMSTWFNFNVLCRPQRDKDTSLVNSVWINRKIIKFLKEESRPIARNSSEEKYLIKRIKKSLQKNISVITLIQGRPVLIEMTNNEIIIKQVIKN